MKDLVSVFFRKKKKNINKKRTTNRGRLKTKTFPFSPCDSRRLNATEEIMEHTTIHPTNPIKKLSSKAAEIYREAGGRICYLCYHCGFDSDGITDILAHIEIHFPSQNPIGADEHRECAEVKCEPLDEDPVLDPNQLEHVFIDCNIKQMLDEEQCEETDDTYSNAVTPYHNQSLLALDDNSTHLEGLFEWKCLHCHCLFKKKCSKLLQHLSQKHGSEVDGANKIKAHYTLKCTLCSSEFADLHSSEQHLKDFHPALPPVKCFTCNEKFPSAESLKHHKSTVHGGTDTDDIVEIQSAESVERKNMLAQKKDKHSVCNLCDKTFPAGRIEFMQHTFGHFNLKVFSCTECPTNFQRLTSFNTHMKKVHNRKATPKLSCRFCNIDHNSLIGFLTHAFTDHLDDGDRNNHAMDTAFEYQCRFCFRQFKKWIDIREHVKDHADDELPSKVPSAVLATGRTFTERARSSTYRSELLYNCRRCTTTLCGSYEAMKHEITDHKSAPIQYVQAPLPNPVRYRIIFMPEKQEKSEKKSFKCFDCDKSFDTEIYLMRHRLSHFDVQPYQCITCPRTFESSANATRHINKEHNTPTEVEYRCRALICRFCKTEFNDDNSFIAHNFKEHLYTNFNIDENLDELCKYQCMYCNEIMMQRHSMDQHLHTHTDEALPETNTQDGAESEESSINELRHKSEFRYLCLHCPLKFRLPVVARAHAKFAHKTEVREITSAEDGTKTVSVTNRSTHCDTCNTTFLTWRSMINHSAQVHPETIVRNPNYKKKVGPQPRRKKKRRSPEGNNCNICNMTFLSNRSMINHRTKRHPESVELSAHRPLHTCSICGRAFRERSNFNKHMETHTNVRSYSCDICDKSYRLKNSLDTHLLTHTNEKNFVCEECGKSFYTTSKLNLHKQVHENLTIHCDKCDKVFYTRNNFSKHQKTHTDNVRKKCKVCGNTFKSAVSLRVHMSLHDDQKKFACRYCELSFAQSSGRRGHERSKHGIV